MKTIEIEIDGMSCGGCVNKIKQHFKDKADVNSTMVSLERKLVTFEAEDELSNMFFRNELVDLGFSVISIKKI